MVSTEDIPIDIIMYYTNTAGRVQSGGVYISDVKDDPNPVRYRHLETFTTKLLAGENRLTFYIQPMMETPSNAQLEFRIQAPAGNSSPDSDLRLTIQKVKYKNNQSVKNLLANGKTMKLYAIWKKK